jgi:2-methylcitrate dehydratase
MDPILASLAEFSSTLSFRDLPGPAVAAAKDRLVDSVGCAIAAHDCDAAEIGRSLAGPAARPELAGRILTSKRTAAADDAAFVNTCMIRKLDLNDIIQGGHPSDMLGALLAVAPQIGASGERLITAMLVSYEVLIRLLKGGLRERGWDQGFGVSVGAAAGVSNLMGLSRAATEHAIAITAVANVPMRATRAGQLSMWKGAATAYAVRNAVYGVQLAAAGMTGPEAPFTGRHGLADLITGTLELTPFGTEAKDFLIPSVYLKYWPVAYSLSPVIWAGIELRKQVAAEALESVEVRTYAFSVMESGSEPGKWDPRTRETADHSIPYVLARTLLHGVVDEDAFAPASYLDPSIRPLMKSITVRVDDGIEKEVQSGTVHVRLIAKDRSGKSYEVNVVNPVGHDKNPFTPAQVAAKFRRLCEPALGKRRTTTALNAWQNIETATDVKGAIDAVNVKGAKRSLDTGLAPL